MAKQHPLPAPLYDDAWEDFLHDVFAGVTGLDPALVRPRWQPEPPLRPDIKVDWLAFGVTSSKVDYMPSIVHYSTDDDGFDALSDHEECTITCSFFGPHAELYCSILRRGLYIDQNRATFRANSVGLVETTDITRTADYIKERWWPRADINIILRREIRFNYNVLNLVRAQGVVIANAPFDSPRVLVKNWDTDKVPKPTEWDAFWDEGDTLWDIP